MRVRVARIVELIRIRWNDMTVYDFKLWLLNNSYTQKSLAKRLQITEQTITKYNNNGRYPVIFCLALKAIEGEKV